MPDVRSKIVREKRASVHFTAHEIENLVIDAAVAAMKPHDKSKVDVKAIFLNPKQTGLDPIQWVVEAEVVCVEQEPD